MSLVNGDGPPVPTPPAASLVAQRPGGRPAAPREAEPQMAAPGGYRSRGNGRAWSRWLRVREASRGSSGRCAVPGMLAASREGRSTPVRVGKHLAAFSATTLALLAGTWLLLAPWILGYQAGVTSGWTNATLTDFWTGVGVVVLAAVTLSLYAGTLLQELREKGLLSQRRRTAFSAVSEEGANGLAARGAPGAAPAAVSGARADARSEAADIDRMLLPLAAALLADLTKRQGAPVTPSAPASGPGGENQ